MLKANAERLVKHTFDMVKQVRLAWVQAAVQEDYKKTKHRSAARGQAVPPRDDGKLPEEDRAAWEAALQEDSPESLHQGAANSLEVTARRRRAFHAPVAEKTKASDYKGHGPARKETNRPLEEAQHTKKNLQSCKQTSCKSNTCQAA